MAGVSSVNANYYNATTKNGAPYRKTNANKKVAVGLGILGSAASTGFAAHLMNVENKPFLKALGSFVKDNKWMVGKSLGAAILGGLIVGAIVDGIVNKVRRNKADKAFKANLNQTV